MKRILYFFVALFASAGCDSTGPSSSFSIIYIEFSGDSIGSGGEKGTPFCEFTLEWESIGSESEYRLYRSLSPDIVSDPSTAVLLCSTAETEWIDGDSLDWGTIYHYAVLADEALWSSEETGTTPGSPYPPSSQLSFEKTGFTDCTLQWTGVRGGFQSYTVLRSDYPGIENTLWYADTIFVSSSADSTFYTDHQAFPEGLNYYCVAVSDEEGLSSFSNEVEFTSGGDIPWIVSINRTVAGLQARNYLVTPDGERMTGSRPYSGYSLGSVFSTADGLPEYSAVIESSYIDELAGGNLLVSHLSPNGNRLSIYSGDLSLEIISRDFPPVRSAVELENGILCGCGSNSYLLDRETLQTLETLPLGFERNVLSSEGDRLFILNSSGVVAIDPFSLNVTGGIPGSFINIQIGTDGDLRCINSQRVLICDPVSLNLLNQFDYPQTAGVPEVVTLPPECDFVYVPVWDNGELVFRVWNIFTGETPGTIIPQHTDLSYVWDLLVSPRGDFLWCLGYEADGIQSIFRISI